MWTTESLWHTFSQRLRSFIAKRVDNPEDVEDLLQELFIRIHTRLDSVKNQEKISAWLYQITRNLIIDYYRARKPAFPIPPTLESHDEIVESDPHVEIAEGLVEMIDSLPERYRQALRMVEMGGLSQVELAKALNLTISGAKSRVQRGRDQLRKVLWDCCHFELDRRNRIQSYYPRNPCCQNCCPPESQESGS